MQPNKIAPLILVCALLCGCDGRASKPAINSSPLVATTPAALPDADAMIKRIITLNGCRDFSAEMRILTDDGKGKRENIEFRVQRKYSDDRTATFLTVLAPAEDTNKALLALEFPDKPTQAYSYLPGLKRLTVISSDRRLGFRNASVTVQDMLGMELAQYDHDAGERVNHEGDSLIKIEFKEKMWRYLAYPRITGFFRERDQNPVKFEIYDHHEELRKRVRVDEIKQIQNRPTITRLAIEDLQQNLKIKIETRRVDYDRGLSNNLFTEARLKSIINDAVERLDQQ